MDLSKYIIDGGIDNVSIIRSNNKNFSGNCNRENVPWSIMISNRLDIFKCEI